MPNDVFNSYVIADKAYGSAKVRTQIKNQKCIDVIPSKTNSLKPVQYDKHIYKERHLIECFSQKLSISGAYFHGLINLPATLDYFYHLLELVYGQDEKSTVPNQNEFTQNL